MHLNRLGVFLVCVLLLVLLLAAAALFRLWDLANSLDPSLSLDDRIEFYKLYVELAKIVVGGFSIAFLGVLIPAVLAECNRFERFRDEKKRYSEAKTAGDYFALRLCSLPLKDAAALLQRVHVKKHTAELYPELGGILTKRGILFERAPGYFGFATMAGVKCMPSLPRALLYVLPLLVSQGRTTSCEIVAQL